MATYSVFSSLISGVQRGVDLSANTLAVLAIQIDGILLSSAVGSGNEGSELVGDFNSYTNFTPTAATVKGALSGIDAKLGSAGSGSVTSVALADDSTTPIYSIGGSPVTTAGTLTLTLNTQAANLVFAGPASGSAAEPTFRSLVAGDLPSLSGTYANIALSNLSATSINASLVPASNNSLNLGNTSAAWANLYIATIINNASDYKVSVLDGNLIDGSSTTSIAWAARELIDSSSAVQLSWSTSGVEFNQLTASTVPYISAGKILTSSAVTPTQLGYLSGASGTTGTGNLVFSASPTFTGTLSAAAASLSGALNMNSNQINNLASPSVSTDAANKGYVDAAISGLTWKGPVAAYSNANVALTGSTPLVIDGYTVLDGDLLLLGNQTTASQNGEYAAAVSGGSYTLTANGQPTAAGDAWLVLNGTAYADSAFVATAAVPAAEFVQFAGPNAFMFTAPLSLSGNTVSLNYDGTTLNLNGSNQLEVANSGITDVQIATSVFDQVTITGGAGTPAAVQQAPNVSISIVAGQAFAANTSYPVRWGIVANSESQGNVYAADTDTSSFDEFYVIGVAQSPTAVSIGQNIEITKYGLYALGSADTAFASGTQGMPAFLGSGGVITNVAPTASGQAVSRIGIIVDTNIIDIMPQVVGVN
jgi:hypothetical protein